MEKMLMNSRQESQIRCAWCRDYFTPTKKRKMYCSTQCYTQQRFSWEDNKLEKHLLPDAIKEFLGSQNTFSYNETVGQGIVNGEIVTDDLIDDLYVEVYRKGLTENRQLVRAVIVKACRDTRNKEEGV